MPGQQSVKRHHGGQIEFPVRVFCTDQGRQGNPGCVDSVMNPDTDAKVEVLVIHPEDDRIARFIQHGENSYAMWIGLRGQDGVQYFQPK
jgi:hypothetical protein